VTRSLVVGAYALLGSILVWSHLAHLGGGYCCDEIATVVDYVQPGPRAIIAGSYSPNNHELYSLVGWATYEVAGNSAIALRLWAAIPFLTGVALVTWWLHLRVGPLTGLLFLFLCTISPLLLDITRQARGYGLAFLAMAVVVVAALETVRTGRTWPLYAVFVAGLAGSWTLPHFSIAFVAVAAILLSRRELRRHCAIGIAISLPAIALWYLPHYDDLARSSLQPYGHRISGAWALTSPIDQTVLPALEFTDDVFLKPSLGSLAFAVAFGILIASSPLLRDSTVGLLLCVPSVATVLVFWATQTHVVPRFFSFLLVPLFMLVASGSASILAQPRTRWSVVRTAVVVLVIGAVLIAATPLVAAIPRLPRQALRQVAETIETNAPGVPVFAHVPYPGDLEYHLGRRVVRVRTRAAALRVCASDQRVAFVDQPWIIARATPPCLGRPGTEHFHFEQYARGDAIDLWLLPPAR
jgi:hypothetical protein